MTLLNKARLDKPARNRYTLRPDTVVNKRTSQVDATPPLLNITAEIAAAAALLAEVEASGQPDAAVPVIAPRAGRFWMEDFQRKGTVPWGDDPNYKVFRNVVTDYGADNTGKKDATAAIQKAIDDGKRCGEKCNGSSTKNAIVYFPAGTYLVSSTIKVYFGTQIIGDANNWPMIKAPASFVGLGVLSTDVYVSNGGSGPDGLSLEWYINTARFYSQIRNLRIDITSTNKNAHICALHYQVAQATSIQNVELIANSSNTQRGMFSENGSGGVMSDITFTGGSVGFYGGNQQFSTMRLKFNGCKTAVQLLWDWGWVWKSTTVNNVDVGFRLMSDDGTGSISSVSFIDSTFSNVKTSAIVVNPLSQTPGNGSTGIILDNVNLGGSIVDSTGKTLLSAGYYKNWVIGPTYEKGDRTWQAGKSLEYTREVTLLGASTDGLQVAPYFERPRSQYEDRSAGDFVHLKDGGAKGDGTTDDTAAVQSVLNAHASGDKIIFVDAGTYILTDTVTVPKDAKIVGETWSQFAASGSKFSDAANPRVMLKIGNENDVGTVEMQDLLLTTKGGTAGVVLMEFNVKAATPGAAAVWDVHARVGGATGTELTPKECPASTSGTDSDSCKAASLLLHITPHASGYFDNMWLWVADHLIDDPDTGSATNDMTQLSVYSARGMLVESTSATWLYGTAAEHNVYYQYNFHNAQNIFTTMIQSESPYYQPTPKPPAPFDKVVGKFPGDPGYGCKGGDFDGCDESWAVIMEGSQNIHIGGAGTYSWFSTYSQDCIDTHTCQKTLWYINGNHDNNRLQHIIGIGAKNVLVADGKAVLATDNLASKDHPSQAHISIFDVPSTGPAPKTPTTDNSGSCNAKYSTFDGAANMGTGIDFNWAYLDQRIMPIKAEFFITIVNLTPYKFVKTSMHKCQLDVFNFTDVPSGRALQARVVYSGAVGSSVDDNAEVYFRLDGTDKTFQVRASTHIPDTHPYRTIFDLTGMGLGQREYKNPYETSSITLVITGSESYGYVTSLNFQPLNWMHGLYDVIKDRQLRHVVMPGSHDAGMTTISPPSVLQGGIASNTQTQGLTIYDQLRVGSRYFDMRIVRINEDGDFYAAHYAEEMALSVSGASGAKLSDMIDQVNRFTAENPGEIIIWAMRYLITIQHGVGGDQWNNSVTSEFFDTLERINNRCPDLDTIASFSQEPARTFLDANGGKGCVLLLTAHEHFWDNVTSDRPSAGIYDDGRLHRDDYWSKADNTVDNSFLQINHTQGISRGDKLNDTLDPFCIMQWQCTPNIVDSSLYGLDRVAVLSSNPALYWYGVNGMSPQHFPTVILEDYIGMLLVANGVTNEDITSFPAQLGAELQTLVIGLNLYMVSQNCNVAKSNPLVGNSSNKPSKRSAATAFRGVIYANGTVDDNPPPGFHLDQVNDCRDPSK
ncbi:hypothetical protein SBRCBS47491_003942 [Sporothrix bragantina]|uniref:Rhamnogalacturonase A/B/Epimerase-like pectate lyase domain-containing protein n=1 Tax=Sporothrix bragantina TaxID=671064 RepID=A0ABP0BJM4_9PEZI